ncbi:retention module-containing protein [Shewanella yunxiaonensis]|uniref:Retention module-containing protein n=1 Tax=Shewanella yunxiaonensis TaxID=2829809 RepID=A0ABX7YTU0_9GAMM|nr:retention module-containing protein [Shewanella yunxiaonensis]QUN06197.1 retention module-containing protein [Shewanella yunxiaonensis]
MNTVITQQDSQINNLKGQIAVVIDGVQHLVKEGEIIPKGAELIIGNNASANLAQADGSNVAIGATEQQGQAAATDAEIQQLQDLIAAGQDPTANLPETAAGNPISGGGDSGYVAVSRDGSEVLASSGYDTGTFSVAGTTTTQDPLTTYLASSAADDVNTIEEDTVATGNVLTNDTISGGSLTVTDYVVEGNSYAAGNTADLENGTLTLNSDGSYTFTPDTNWNGTVPVITYTTSAGDTATLTITVTPVNDAPVLAPDVGSVDESATLTVSAINGVLSNDTDVDGNSLTVTGIMTGTAGTMTAVTSGSATTLTNEYGTLTINADGSYNFAATGEASKALADGENAETVFTYTATDGTDALTSTLTITISGVDDTISLMGLDGVDQTVVETNLADGSSPDSELLTQDGTFSFSTTGIVDTLTVDGATLTLDQLQNLGSDPVTITTEHGTLVLTNYTGDETGGEVSYSYTLDTSVNNNTVPGADDNGYTESFAVTVTATDGNSQSDSLDIYIADDVPSVSEMADINVDEGTSSPEGTLAFAGGADGATVTAINGETLQFGQDGYSQAVDVGNGTVMVKADGTYIYTADDNLVQPASDTFTYTVTDGDGDTVQGSLKVNITDANTPTAGTSAAAVDDDGLPGGIAGGTGDDTSTNSATATGNLTFSYGGDGQGTTGGIAFTNTTGTVGTETVSYAWNSNTLTATITDSSDSARIGTTLFTVTITDMATGAYTVTLAQNVLHTAGNDENDATAALTFTVTDADGSTATTGELNISFDDDTPTVSTMADINVDEGTSSPEGTLAFAGGADGATVTAINGETLQFGQDGYSQAVDVGNGTVMVKADGTYIYTADDNLVQPASDTFTYTVTDGDGDTVQGSLKVNITDANTPTAGTSAAAVDDDGLPGGIAGGTGDDTSTNSATATGNLTFSYGGDGQGTTGGIAFTNTTGTVGTETVSYAWNSNTLTATITDSSDSARIGTTLFTVTITDMATGAYTVTLAQNVLHTAGNDENDATAALTFTVTDADGSTATTGELNISFDDDTPTVSTMADINVDEGTSSPEGTLAFAGGADGATVTAINGETLQFGQDGYSQAVDVGNGTVMVKADGTYIYTADDNLVQPASDTFTYTVTDGDGDTVQGSLKVNITDANTPTAGTSAAAVDDDGLPGGIAGGTGDDTSTNSATATGNLTFSYGGDGQGTTGGIAFTNTTGTVGTETVSYAWNSNTLTATITDSSDSARIGTTLFTVTITDMATGAYTVTLAQNVLHTAGNDENDATAALTFTVTDADGSTATTGELNISFDDDTPTVSTMADINVDEGTSSPEGTLAFAGGADGATVTAINGETLQFGQDGYSQAVDVGNGTVMVKADGTYIYTADDNLVQPASDTFTYTVTDGDGDTVQGSLKVNITDANTPTAGTSAAAVDDDGLPGGIAGGTGDDTSTNSATATGNLTFSYGGDGQGTTGGIAFTNTTGTVGTETVSYAWNSNTLTATITDSSDSARIGTTLFTVTITDMATGAYTVTLAQNVLHTAGNDENDATAALTFTVTDADGSTATTGELNISFDDDTPTVSTMADINVDEGTSSPEGTLAFAGGADGATVTAINGETLQFGQDGYSQAVDVGNGTVMVKADGTYIYTADDNLVQPASDTFTYTVTDGDGDTVQGSLKVNITDANTPTAGTSAAAVDDDGLPGGIAGGTGDDTSTNSATATGNLTFSYGGDGQGTTGGIAFTNTTGTVGTETVSYAWNSNTLTATITDSSDSARIGTTLFTVTITDMATGAYTVTLAQNVLHTAGNDENDATAALTFTVTDADGSTATTGELNISFDDDTPTVSTMADINVDEGTSSPEGTLAFAGGADGATVTAINGETLQFGQDGYSQAVDVGNGTVMVKADGTYIYTADDNLVQPASDTFTYTVTDGDGDTVQGSLKVNITDANTPTAGTSAAAVDDDGLPGGIAGGTGDDTSTNSATATGNLTFSYGGDGQGTTGGIAFTNTTGTVGTETVSYAWNSNTLTATITDSSDSARIGTTLFTVTITDMATGAYTVTLAQNVLHTAGNDENDATAALTFTVTDADGSTATTGELNISFDDDTPTVSTMADINVDEGTSSPEGTLAFAGGADGATVTAINGETLQFGQDGYSQAVDVGNGTVMVKADGTYIYTADDNLVQPASDTFTYTVTDGDGDTVQGSLKVNITDANTPTAGTSAAAVDDDGLPGGIAGGTGDDTSTNSATATGNLTFSYGGDGQGTTGGIAFTNTTGTVGTETVSYAWNSNTLTATITDSSDSARIGTTLFTVTITDMATGAYTVTLAQNVLHTAGNDENDATAALTFTVTDADGSTATTGELNISFDDDTPTVSTMADINVDEGTSSPEGTLAFAGGADGATVTAINGETLQFGQDGYSQAVDVGNGTVMVKADGTYIYTADDNLVQPASDTFTYTVTDGDGDTVQGSLKVNITDANTPTAGTSAAAVDDDGLPGGIAGGTGDDTSTNSATATGNLTFSYGGDGQGTTGGIAFTNTTGTVGTETVSYAWNSNTLTATITDSSDSARIGTTLFTVTITDMATGAYTVTLAQNVLHTAGNDENDATAALTFTVTDADGSTATTGELNISFDDDTPTVSTMADINVDEGTSSPEGTLAFAGGADGATVTAINGETLQFGQDGYSQAVDVGNGTVMVKADGTYIYTADDNLVQPASDTFTYTVTDGDGDTVQGSLKVNITDANTPTAGTSAAAVDDDGLPGGIAGGTGDDTSTNSATATGNLTFSYGGDGQGTTGGIAFTNTTGTVGTETVSYAWNSNTLTATITDSSDSARIGTTLFTVTITDMATGAYTVTLAQNVLHTAGNDENDATAALTFTVTDADGSTATTGELNISFDDDTPTAATAESVSMLNANGGNDSAYLDLDHTLSNNYGADGGSAVFTADTITSLENQGLSSGLVSLNYAISADGTVLTATNSINNSLVFTIALQPDGSSDQYVVTMSQSVDAVSTVDFNDGGYNFVGGNASWAGFTIPGDNDSQDLLLTSVSGTTVNTNANSGGIGAGSSVGAGEAMRVDYVTDLSGTPVNGKDFSDAANQTQIFDGHYNVNGGSALFTSIGKGGSTVSIAAFDDDDSGANLYSVGDGSPDAITSVGISYGTEQQVITSSGDYVIDSHTFSVTFNNDGTVSVAGVVDNTQLSAYTADGYNSIEWGYESGSTFQIGDFGATTVTTDDVDFTVPISIQDGDGDIVSSGDLAINLYSGDTSSSTLAAASTSSLMSLSTDGSDSSHSIYSTSADDILTASTGIDTFIWQAGQTGTDHVSGFNLTQDTLNISDLLTQWNGNSNTLDHYLDITVTNGDTVISIDADANGSVDQTIVLDGTDVSSYGNSSSEIIQGLVDSGNGPLIVDSSSTDTATTTYSTTDALNHTEQVVKEV